MRYHNITKDDMLNGDGLRVVLWVAGCTHRCKGCHNPETWDCTGGILFDKAARQELFSELDKNYISGITFTGGDPLHPENAYEIFKLSQKCRQEYPDKTIWLYTGYEWEDIEGLDIMDYIDVLVDGEFLLEQRDTQLYWKGSANQRVIDVVESKKQGKVILHIDGGE